MNNQIYGTFWGNLTGTVYFLLFQAAGLFLIRFFFHQKENRFYLLAGSVLGSVLFHWLPAVCSFFSGFTMTAHLLALFLLCLIFAVLLFTRKPFEAFHSPSGKELLLHIRSHGGFLLLSAFTFLLFIFLLHTHTLLPMEDGLHTGQCSYGDMNLHLGIITSLATQQTFPPEYSISPGDLLCYPFLCDSNSASIYLFGASLRYSYILPMLFAFIQVMTGFYLIALELLKTRARACVAFFLYFYNGGLGIAYFIDHTDTSVYHFSDIFTGYYLTPTNLVANNIRWVNIIADMLLPQRATLFGYAILFPCVWLLIRAIYRNEPEFFPLVGLLAGALPMIHTHSFLAMALISAAWLLSFLLKDIPLVKKLHYPAAVIFTGLLIFMCTIQVLHEKKGSISSDVLLTICVCGLLFLLFTGICALAYHIRQNGWRTLLKTWFLYPVIVLLLALPQLFFWTFSQTGNDGFLTGHFNWGNNGDNYLWFYIKNWGIILLLLIPGVCFCSKRNSRILTAGFLIWFVSELISFSPNTYDNNKLIYVGYLFFVCISVEYGSRLYHAIRHIPGTKLLTACFFLLAGSSGILSLGREAVSDYLVYSNDQLALAEYVIANTSSTDTFLTNDRHVNEISSLTGRNIVNGTSIFLWPHGIYDEERVQDVQQMYEHPSSSLPLFQKYEVDYVVISSWERNSYEIEEDVFRSLFPCVYSYGEFALYQVTD